MSLIAEATVFALAVLVMLVGLVGIILPVMPGLVLIWLGAFGYALAENFRTVDPLAFTFLTILVIAGVSADIWVTQLGARMGGASLGSQLLGLAAGAVGAAVFLVFGGLSAGLGAVIGSIAGVLAAEYFRFKSWSKALKASGGWLLGWLASTVVQLAIGGLVILIVVWQVFRG